MRMSEDFETSEDADARVGGESKYRAPALEKGLDILELLAQSPSPQIVAAICRQLGRSTSEVFRMIQVLEHRGYIERPKGSDGFQLTSKLFALGMIQPPVKGLVEVALPHMRELSSQIGQSCHLAMHSQGQIVVVARMESNAEIGFSVRVGYRQPLMATLSGLVLYAFQDDATKLRWDRYFNSEDIGDLRVFRKRADAIQNIGHAQAASNFVAGVTDLSAPILRGSLAAAALTVPFVQSSLTETALEESLLALVETAKAISFELTPTDARV